MAESILLQPTEYARLAVDAALDKQASDVLMLDVRGISDFADFFVLLTADSKRQLDALAEEIEAALKRQGASLHHREGNPDSGWVLLDFGDLIVHIFGSEEREYYRLEQVWSKALQVVRIL
ncbi:MAG: ribosome silencing factor [Chloroflexi bacterium]|nr:ribosome silencing factor [Chloroflexota bacterium]